MSKQSIQEQQQKQKKKCMTACEPKDKTKEKS
jgi:hypothetical protein